MIFWLSVHENWKTTMSPPLLSKQTQLCHNPFQKDVSTQVWEATANANMMFDKQFYKQVLAKLQWTNSSNGFLLETYKLLHASEITPNRFYKYHWNYFVNKTQRILFTRLKHRQASVRKLERESTTVIILQQSCIIMKCQRDQDITRFEE